MKEILFLAHRVPFPPDRGDKIRSHHILKELARLAPVHVGCFADGPADTAYEAELAQSAATYCMLLRSKPLTIAGSEAMLGGKPVSLAAFHHRELAHWVEHILATRDIGAIYVFSGQMGQYVPQGWIGRLIVDLVDVDSAKFEAYAQQGGALMRWIHGREGRLLRAEEARLATRADHTLLVSDAEAALLKSRLPEGAATSVSAIGNGIDAEAFDPLLTPSHSEMAGPEQNIVFTGQMDYPPNIEAALRMIDRIMPKIRARLPHCRCHIVGRSPVADLLARNGQNGTRVWGEVPDVRPFLAGADVAVAPLVIARGVQNKVLEAMAMARPVVLTTGAATGLPGSDGIHFLVADTDEHIAEQVLELMANPERARRIGAAARAEVVRERNWQSALAPLRAILGNKAASGWQRHAA